MKAAPSTNQVHYGFKMSELKTKGVIYLSPLLPSFFFLSLLQCCWLQRLTKICFGSIIQLVTWISEKENKLNS